VYRRFIVGLKAPGEPGEGMSLEEFSKASSVPLGTLKEWLARKSSKKSTSESPEEAHSGQSREDELSEQEISDQVVGAESQPTSSGDEIESAETEPSETEPPAKQPVLEMIRNTQLRTVATLWTLWQGTFLAFCCMIRTEQRLPFSDGFIGNFLEGMGLRNRKKKSPVEAIWSGGTFRRLFPGAQWLADGTSVAIRWCKQIFVFNIEALLDSATNAVVGITVSDAENEEALRLAYEAGLKTTGSPPSAVTVDNKPCNISPGGREAVGAHSSLTGARLNLGSYVAHTAGWAMIAGAAQVALRHVCHLGPGTIFLRATPGRGQAKAPLEGAFGLFQQALPPLVVDKASSREMARSVLELIFTAWFRGRNGKPRKRSNGRSPAEDYTQARPTEEQIRRALKWFQELLRREELARRTREARRDPVRLELLRQGLAELGISDPKGHLAIALAYYSPEAITQGLAVFRAKKALNTLPSGADHGRYLGGIIRQIDTQLELERISEHYLQQRIRFGDITLSHLEIAARQIQSEVPQDLAPQSFVDRALKATHAIDFTFWARAAAIALESVPADKRLKIYRSLSHRIATAFKSDKTRRERLICNLAETAALAA
jgi:hypothetical protein